MWQEHAAGRKTRGMITGRFLDMGCPSVAEETKQGKSEPELKYDFT